MRQFFILLLLILSPFLHATEIKKERILYLDTVKYIANEDKLEKVLENPQVIKTPVVRNGKQSTLGYQPDVWKKWN